MTELGQDRGDEPGAGDRDPERQLESGDDPVREHEVPESIDVQPEDPDHPGRESPEPVD